MIVEIHGAGFSNKGAELMLQTTIQELRRRISDFIPVIDVSYGSYTERSNLSIGQTFPTRTHVGSRKFQLNFQRQKIF